MGTCDRLDLLLIRHGVTDWNKQKRYLGHTDIGLLQSELETLDGLKKQIYGQPFSYVFSSDLRRCQETLDYLNVKMSVIVDERLREINFGDWEGKTYDELKCDANYQEWLNDWEQSSPPNGEAWSEFTSRIDLFLDELIKRVQKEQKNKFPIVMVTHGGVIRYLLLKFYASRTLWDFPVEHGKALKLSLIWQRGEWICNSLSVVPTQESEN
ncbi:histidine phosphatase family protein [Anaerobacillus alkalidiazotrophicus]|uniref:histidine phosphatase family protein n=1 Tax=Anaerobacillus alkalidiazotrophicus TaxID=472963 RepID=UPI000A02FF1D|nr:histidine phosphatase family protein [Anaerobacillus alkalidiazotrophicus]